MLVAVLVLLVGVLTCFGIAAKSGAPYVRTLRKQRIQALDILGDLSGKKLVDLGSGDGQVLIEAQSRGAIVSGYEINPLLWLWSNLRLRGNGRVYLRSFWSIDTSDYDVVFVFLLPKYMKKLEAKLNKDGFDGSLVSFSFEVPDRGKHQSSTDTIHLYKF